MDGDKGQEPVNYTNIDDVLNGAKTTTQPATPESQYLESEPETINNEEPESKDTYGENEPEALETINNEPKEDVTPAPEYDEYGNQTEGMKKRLKKQADKYESRIEQLEQQIANMTPRQQAEVKQAADDFKSNPDSEASWEEQLNAHIEQAVVNMQRKQAREVEEREAQQYQREFERKLFSGMDKFSDFKDTISDLGFDITDHMTNATRDLADPAAFLYAAAKRHPKELERISKLRDPYAQVREMGKLEERMRQHKPTTQAPRPLGRTQEDYVAPSPKAKKEDTIEDLIAKNDAKKLAQMKARGGRR